MYLKYIKEEKDLILGQLNLQTARAVPLAFASDKPVKRYENAPLEDTYSVNSSILEQHQARPLVFIKGVLNKNNVELLRASEELNKPVLFTFKQQDSASAAAKTEDSAPLWGYRQKKYKRLKKYMFTETVQYDPITFLPISNRGTNPLQLKSTLITPLLDTSGSSFNYQQSIVYARQRSELVPVNLARRLLRTKRTLVLPAHVNITVITNSYDVVHSWFIPGLGLKMDCVPGRSTHHSFYIDNVGFYYGQCAEICGRYHHHMPIRICALPFEQFFAW